MALTAPTSETTVAVGTCTIRKSDQKKTLAAVYLALVSGMNRDPYKGFHRAYKEPTASVPTNHQSPRGWINWVAVKELNLSHHDGYIGFRV